MLINCDIGERGVAHKVDDELMAYIDIANIACSGHAGDHESIEYYIALAKEHNVKVTAHLSYPDKINFGREILNISDKELLSSFDKQYSFLDEIKAVKLHGALYNQANINTSLAKIITSWLVKNGIQEVLTQHESQLDFACKENSIDVIYEAFLDRRYIYENSTLKLSSRSSKDAVIHNANVAKKQFDNLSNGYVIVDDVKRKLKAKTLCIHSDSPSAIEILKAIKDV